MNLRGLFDRFLTTTGLLALVFGMGCLLAGGTASADAEDFDESTERSRYVEEERSPDGWEYDPYYIFPLTRHMSDSGLPRGGQIALYPLAFVIDLGQWPFGGLAGLAGK